MVLSVYMCVCEIRVGGGTVCGMDYGCMLTQVSFQFQIHIDVPPRTFNIPIKSILLICTCSVPR